MFKIKLLIGLSVWMTVLVLGFWSLALYETRPGRGAVAPADWPDRSKLTRTPNCWTLLMIVHPRCTCSRASLDELASLLSANPQNLKAIAVFCKPIGVPEGWERTALWRQAVGMNGIDVYSDNDDTERRLFGAQTSGQVLLFDREGHLRYSSGITRARGQTGDNLGRSALEAILRGGSPSISSTPVFGCPLVNPESCLCKKGSPCPAQQ